MNETSTIMTMLALGVIAGVLSGMFGIGGGLVIVPALVIGFGLDQKTATGTSLFALMWPVGLLGVLEYYRRGELKAGAGLWIALGLFLGAYGGARLVGLMSVATLRRSYGVFLLIVGTYYLTATRSATPRPDSPAVVPKGN